MKVVKEVTVGSIHSNEMSDDKPQEERGDSEKDGVSLEDVNIFIEHQYMNESNHVIRQGSVLTLNQEQQKNVHEENKSNKEIRDYNDLDVNFKGTFDLRDRRGFDMVTNLKVVSNFIQQSNLPETTQNHFTQKKEPTNESSECQLNPRLKARQAPFIFTKPSKEERQWKRKRIRTWILLILYNVTMLLLTWFYLINDEEDASDEDLREDLSFQLGEVTLRFKHLIIYALVLSFNFLVIYPLGTLAIRAIVFPLSFWASRSLIKGSNSIGYGESYLQLAEKCYVIMQTQMQQPDKKDKLKHESDALNKMQKLYDITSVTYDKQEINEKIRSLFNLSKLYAQTNIHLIRSKTLTYQLFIDVTDVLQSISNICRQLECQIRDSWGIQWETIKLSEYYKDNYVNYGPSSLPIIIDNESNKELLEQFEQKCIKFRNVIDRANNPINFGCCRCNCCWISYKNLFHSDDQMEYMLAKNFDGKRFWVTAQDGTKLDCMFFPTTSEKVVTVEEQKLALSKNDIENGGKEADYLYHPTLIFFNPNGQCYQQQVHSPNCFWLKFFQENKINVMAWNYRDYGRSGGTPNPFISMHDSESILKFIIKELGVKGKIGCFGRSLGGTMASHIAFNYPQFIEFLFVDRSLGNLNIISEKMLAGKWNQGLLNQFSQGWALNNDKNFYEAQCFKIVTQDPNDNIIDHFCALSSQTARLACEDYVGIKRYSSLNIEKTYRAFRMLFTIEKKLHMLLKQSSPLQKKNLLHKRRTQRQHITERNAYDSAGYPVPTLNNKEPQDRQQVKEQDKKQGPSPDNTKSAGYSTDADQFARSKRLLALENQWKKNVKENQISDSKLDKMLQLNILQNFNQYQNIQSSLQNASIFISDFDAGILNLGKIINVNKTPDSRDLTLFVDNLFTYGSEYFQHNNQYQAMQHRKQRLKSIQGLTYMIRALNNYKQVIKNTYCKREEDSLKHLALACMSIILKFFEGVKKQLKKSEVLINFDARDVGHLIPLSTGHANKPTDLEIQYIKTVMKLSEFKYLKPEYPNAKRLSPEVSYSPYIPNPITSGLLPNPKSPQKLKQLHNQNAGQHSKSKIQANQDHHQTNQHQQKLIEKSRNSYMVDDNEQKGQDKDISKDEKISQLKGFQLKLNKTMIIKDLKKSDRSRHNDEAWNKRTPVLSASREIRQTKKSTKSVKSCRSAKSKSVKSVKSVKSFRSDEEGYGSDGEEQEYEDYNKSFELSYNKENNKSYHNCADAIQQTGSVTKRNTNPRMTKYISATRSVGQRKSRTKYSMLATFGRKNKQLKITKQESEKIDGDAKRVQCMIDDAYKSWVLSSNSQLSDSQSDYTPKNQMKKGKKKMRSKKSSSSGYADDIISSQKNCKSTKRQSIIKSENQCQPIMGWSGFKYTFKSKNHKDSNHQDKAKLGEKAGNHHTHLASGIKRGQTHAPIIHHHQVKQIPVSDVSAQNPIKNHLSSALKHSFIPDQIEQMHQSIREQRQRQMSGEIQMSPSFKKCDIYQMKKEMHDSQEIYTITSGDDVRGSAEQEQEEQEQIVSHFDQQVRSVGEGESPVALAGFPDHKCPSALRDLSVKDDQYGIKQRPLTSLVSEGNNINVGKQSSIQYSSSVLGVAPPGSPKEARQGACSEQGDNSAIDNRVNQ